jgi:hypothetical protein
MGCKEGELTQEVMCMAMRRSNKGPIVESSGKRFQLAMINHHSKLTPNIIAPPKYHLQQDLYNRAGTFQQKPG